MTVTIYHNPDCGTSRNTLAMIRQSGIEPDIIEYLKTPPSRQTLKELIAAMGIPVRTCCAKRVRPTSSWGLTIPGGPTTSCWTSCWRIPS
jgi:arsenate reductase